MDVYRQADGPRLIGNGPHDALLDPPRCVGGEAEATFGVKLLAGAGEAQRTLLAEVLEVEAPVLVPLGDADDEAEVGFCQGGFGAEGAADLFFHFGDCHSFLDGGGPFLICWWPEWM